MKVQISIDDALMNKVDDYAKSHYLTRSGMFSMVLAQYLDYQDIMQGFGKMFGLMSDLSATTEIDEKTQDKLTVLKDIYEGMSNNLGRKE